MQRCLIAATILLALAVRAHAQQAEPPLDKLLAQVKQAKNINQRAAALANIAKQKPEVAVPALVGLLKAPSEDIRLQTALALGEIGKPAVAALQTALTDEHEAVRFYSAWALGQIGPKAKSATPALIAALRDEDEEVRYKAAFALGHVACDSDEAVAALVTALKDADSDVVTQAVTALSNCGVRAVGPLRNALAQRQVVRHTLHALGKLARATDDETAKAAVLAVPEALIVLDGAKGEDERQLMWFVCAFGPRALPALHARLADKNPRMRWRLTYMIGEIGRSAGLDDDPASAGQAMATLIKLCADRDLDVRMTACKSLGQFASPEASTCQRALNRAMLDDWFEFSYAAFSSLWNDADDPDEFEEQLGKRIIAAKGDDQVRLACLRPRRHTDLLEKNLRHRDAVLRLRCACALTMDDASARWAPTRTLLLPILMDGLNSTTPSRRRDAAEALERLAEHPGADIIPPLLAALGCADNGVRLPAIEGLAHVAKHDRKKVAAALAPLLRTDDPDLRQSVIETLEKCGAAAVPHLSGLLKHPDAETRKSACDSLAGMFADAKDAVPALAALAKTPGSRDAATHALQLIAPDKSFALLLDVLESDKTVGATLRRVGKAGKEPTKLLAALLRELQDSDPGVGRGAAEALEQLEKIAFREHNWFYRQETLRVLQAIPSLAAKRLAGAERGARYAAVRHLISVRSIVQNMQNGLGLMTQLDPGVSVQARRDALAKLGKAIESTLHAACYNSDRDVRGLARRAIRVSLDPWSTPWMDVPPPPGLLLPRFPARFRNWQVEVAAEP